MVLKASAFRHMVDCMPINILVCDAKTLIITYANKKSCETLDSLAGVLPAGISGKTIVGQCIDVFHKNPGHQRAIIGDARNLPHSAVIRLGKEFLHLQVAHLPGGIRGSHLMLTWTVVTQVEKLRRMVDKMPINIMMADPDTLEVTFMNQTSLNTLRTVEHLLPIKADQVLGSCIDVFHKQPEHQRRLLADPKNLPHRAKIRLGDEWLELNVAAIVDDQGAYLGPMVSWSVVTAQVRVAETVRQIASSVAGAARELSDDAQTMGTVVSHASEQATSASGASAQTSMNVQAVASAVEEMSASVAEIAENTAKSKAAMDNVAVQAGGADAEAKLARVFPWWRERSRAWRARPRRRRRTSTAKSAGCRAFPPRSSA